MNTSILRKENGNVFFNEKLARPVINRRGKSARSSAKNHASDTFVGGFLVAILFFVLADLAYQQTGTTAHLDEASAIHATDASSASATIPWRPYPKP